MFIYLSIDYDHALKQHQPRITQDDVAFYVNDAPGTIQAYVRRRDAYPKTYCQVSGDTLLLGYGSKNTPGKKRPEFLEIRLQSNGNLSIERDEYAVLPLFYGMSGNRFILSNSYAAVCDAFDTLTLSKKDFVDNLLPNTDAWPTLWEEVQILGEREILHRQNGHLAKQYPPNRAWHITADAPRTNPADFKQLLEEVFEYSLQTYAPAGTKGVFEISGGLDSSTMPLYTALHHPERQWLVHSLLLPGYEGETQQPKLEAIMSRMPGSSSVPVHMDDPELRLPLLSDAFQEGSEALFYASLNPGYGAQTEKAIPLLASRHAQVLFSGHGSDDLFGHFVGVKEQLGYGSEEAERRLSNLPVMYTPAFASLLQATASHVPRRPLPLLPATAILPASANSSFIEAGIWPVFPFLDSELYTYCQGLPWTFRKNKRILRTYQAAQKYPPVLFDQNLPNERLGNFFGTILAQPFYRELIEYYAQNSVVAAMGYIDIDKLLLFYNQGQDSFAIFHWLRTEMVVHRAMQSGKWRPVYVPH